MAIKKYDRGPEPTSDDQDSLAPGEQVDDGTLQAEVQHARLFVWNGSGWDRMTQPGGAGGGDGAILDGVSATIKATVKDYTNSNPLATVLVDTDGNPYTAGGGAGGGLTDTQLRASPVPVSGSGTFHVDDNGGSLTVDGAVSVSNFPATQPVSGTVDTELPAAAALSDADPSTPTVPTVGAAMMVHDGNAGNMKRAKTIFNTMNTNAAGVLAAGNVAQFDDVGPGAITENNFGPLRMSSRRELYVQLRDAAGNERGLNIDASGRIAVDASGVTVPVSGPLTDAQLRANPVPVTIPSPTPVTDNAGSLTVDAPVATPVWVRLSDGAAAYVGQKAMASSLPVVIASDQSAVPVSGTFFQATQPVSIAAALDVSDRDARLLGRAKLLDSSGAVIDPATKAQLPAALDGSGFLKVHEQGTASENLAQVGGTAIAAKAVPTNADGQVALPVYVNAQQYATYDVAARNLVSGVLTANTAKAMLSLEHALASTKTVRIRRIMIHMIQTTALSGLIDVQITRGTAASSAGSAITPQARRLTDPAAEVVVKSLPTIVAASVADNIPAGGFATTTTLYSAPVLVYDWQESGETKPYMLVAGALQSLVINVISTAAHNLTMTISVDLTEE